MGRYLLAVSALLGVCSAEFVEGHEHEHTEDVRYIGRNNGLADFQSTPENVLSLRQYKEEQYLEVPEEGVTIAVNTTTLSHYRGFFMYYCVSGFQGELDTYPNELGEEFPEYSVLPSNVFTQNFRYKLTAEDFTDVIANITLADFTYTVYNGDITRDPVYAEKIGMEYSEESSKCMKAQIRGVDKIIVKSEEVLACTLLPDSCQQYESYLFIVAEPWRMSGAWTWLGYACFIFIVFFSIPILWWLFKPERTVDDDDWKFDQEEIDLYLKNQPQSDLPPDSEETH